jgi:chemotaxis protein MotA
MDFASIAGIVIAIAAIVGGQALDGGHAGSLFQLTAAVIVLGGTFGACLVNYPLKDFLRGLGMAKLAFLEKKIELRITLEELVALATLSRREGLIALEAKIPELKDPFLARTLEHAVDGVSATDVRNLMEEDVALEERTELTAAGLFETAGGYAPTVGILGAVLGLIHVMENLDDPSKLGGGIATAFVATVYGVGAANLVFLPIGNKLKRKIQLEGLKKAMVIEGVCAIIEGVNGSVLQKRLHAYVAQAAGKAEPAAEKAAK